MSTVTIEWTQRAAGRERGHRETVELTDFINGVINGGNAVIIIEHDPIVGFEPAEPVEAEVEPEVEASDAEPSGH